MKNQCHLSFAALLVAASLSGSNAFVATSNNDRGRRAILLSDGRYAASPSSAVVSHGHPFLPKNKKNHMMPPVVQRSASSSSSLRMGNQGAALAAITGCISGGLFAGSLHAIAGPDHLAALLPRCCGQRWYRAGRVGALWGIGHGVSATILGVLAYLVKNTFKSSVGGDGFKRVLAGASHATEIAVGLSLIVIGAMGIREAREWEDEMTDVRPMMSLSAAATAETTAGTMKSSQKRAVVLNGILHGFSWDGAPSLAPAVAVASWSGNLAFLSAYAFGTMTAMAAVTTLIGEGTRSAGQFFNRPDIPQKLSLFSSIFAIAIGVLWCGLAVV